MEQGLNSYVRFFILQPIPSSAATELL